MLNIAGKLHQSAVAGARLQFSSSVWIYDIDQPQLACLTSVHCS